MRLVRKNYAHIRYSEKLSRWEIQRGYKVLSYLHQWRSKPTLNLTVAKYCDTLMDFGYWMAALHKRSSLRNFTRYISFLQDKRALRFSLDCVILRFYFPVAGSTDYFGSPAIKEPKSKSPPFFSFLVIFRTFCLSNSPLGATALSMRLKVRNLNLAFFFHITAFRVGEIWIWRHYKALYVHYESHAATLEFSNSWKKNSAILRTSVSPTT